MYHVFEDDDLKNKYSICKDGVILTIDKDSMLEAEDDTLFDPNDKNSGGLTVVYLYLNDLKLMIKSMSSKRGKTVVPDTSTAYSEFKIVDLGNDKNLMIILRANAFREVDTESQTVTFLLPSDAIEKMKNKLEAAFDHDSSIRHFEKSIAPLLQRN